MAAILTLTLWPIPSQPTRGTFRWCLACGQLGPLDVFHNILLFMPLGAALVWTGVRWRPAVLLGFLLSLAIELAQLFWIPGRDASLSDVLTNTTGTLVGCQFAMHLSVWLAPTPQVARRWAIGWAALLVAVLGGTAVLLHPLVPAGPLTMEWAPRHRHIVPFRGRVLAAALNGRAAPVGPVRDPDRLRREAAQDRIRIEADVIAGPDRRRGIMPIVQVRADDDDDDEEDVLNLAQHGRDLLFRVRLDSTGLGLRTLTLAVPDGLPPPGASAHLEGTLDGVSIAADVVRDGGVKRAALALSPALGWAFLTPADIPLGAWVVGASAAWLALLGFPLGFYGAGATQVAGADPRPAARHGWLLVPVAALITGLGLVPLLAGLAPLPWTNWAAAAAGSIVGGAAWHATARWRSRLAGLPGGDREGLARTGPGNRPAGF